MAATEIQLLDIVAMTVDVPSAGLLRGHVGTVVEVYAPDAFEVEFVDSSGHTYALETLRADQIMLLRHEPVAA